MKILVDKSCLKIQIELIYVDIVAILSHTDWIGLGLQSGTMEGMGLRSLQMRGCPTPNGMPIRHRLAGCSLKNEVRANGRHLVNVNVFPDKIQTTLTYKRVWCCRSSAGDAPKSNSETNFPNWRGCTRPTEEVCSKQNSNQFMGFNNNKLVRLVTTIFRDWSDSAPLEAKQRIREAATLLLLTGFLVIFNAFNSRLCRPALACSPPATTATDSASSQSNDFTIPTPTTQTKEGEGDGDGGEALAAEYLKTHPNDISSLKILLHTRMIKRDIPGAVEILDRMMLVEPYEIEWKLLKAQAHFYLGDMNEARLTYERILKFSPFSPAALQGLATVMQKCGDEDAIVPMLAGTLEKALIENKVKAVQNLRLLLGEYYLFEKKYQEALMNYQDVVKEDPEDFRPYFWQGIIYSILEKKDEASKQFEKYRQLAKDFPDQNLLDNLMSAKMAESFKHNGQEKDEAENLPKEDELSKPLDASGAGGDTLYVEDKSDN